MIVLEGHPIGLALAALAFRPNAVHLMLSSVIVDADETPAHPRVSVMCSSAVSAVAGAIDTPARPRVSVSSSNDASDVMPQRRLN